MNKARPLREICEQGLARRYGPARPEAVRRLEYELGRIEDLGLGKSFRLSASVVELARQTGALLGPGRGAAACSIVNYLLGLTEIDPLEHDLPFERYCSYGHLPDLLVDVDSDHRSRLWAHLRDRYGRRLVSDRPSSGDAASDDIVCCQLHSSRSLGGLRSAIELLRSEQSGVEPLPQAPGDDPQTFAVLADPPPGLPFFEGDLRLLLREIAPGSFAELATLYGLTMTRQSVALQGWRLARSEGGNRAFESPEIASILSGTHGVVVFQEQIMWIASRVAGLDPDESNELRRAVGRKKGEELSAWQEKFEAGAVARGSSKQEARSIWGERILRPADWAVCQAHALSYGLLTYRAAWLCAHFPAAYRRAFAE